MRIHLHIGLEQVGAARLQSVLADKREQLAAKGILFPRSPGPANHTRLYMAVTDPDHIDPLRFNRGYIAPAAQSALLEEVTAGLERDIGAINPTDMILSASQLGASLYRDSELQRLKSLLNRFSDDIRIIAHVDEQSALLARHYAHAVMEGRGQSLELEQELAGTKDWWDDCLLDAHKIDPVAGQFLETQAPPFWLDYTRLIAKWEAAFGAGTVHLRPYDETRFYSEDATEELREAFDIKDSIGRAQPADIPAEPAAAWVARGRQMNALFLQLLKGRKRIITRPLWREQGAGENPARAETLQKTPREKGLGRSRPHVRFPPDAIFAGLYVAHQSGHQRRKRPKAGRHGTGQRPTRADGPRHCRHLAKRGAQ